MFTKNALCQSWKRTDRKKKREKKKERDVNDQGKEERGKKETLTTTLKYDSNIKKTQQKYLVK